MCSLELRPDGDAPLAGKCLVVDPGLTPDQLAALDLAASEVAELNRLGAGDRRVGNSEIILKGIAVQIEAATRGIGVGEFDDARKCIAAAMAWLVILSEQTAAAERLHELARGVCSDLWPEAPVAPASDYARKRGGPS